MSKPTQPTVSLARVAHRVSERTGENVSKEWVRRRVQSGRLRAERAGHGPTAPYMFYERDVDQFVERETHRIRAEKAERRPMSLQITLIVDRDLARDMPAEALQKQLGQLAYSKIQKLIDMP